MKNLKQTLKCIFICTLVVSSLFACKKDEDVKKIPVKVESISLDKNELSLKIGETVKLVSTILPEKADNKKVNWLSTDISVASVDQTGELKTIKNGKTDIIVTTEDGKKTAKCSITVLKNEPVVVKVESITLVPNLNITVGDETVIITKILPANASNVKYYVSTSDANIVFFADGTKDLSGNLEIIGNKAGVTTLTFTTIDGAKTAKCVVTVKEKQIPVESISLDKELSMFVGESKAITTSVLPANASNKKFTWVIANEAVASVNSDCSSVEGLVKGETTITLTTEDGAKTAICKVIVNEKTAPVTSCIDPEGREYKTVVIGKQTWMAENYAYFPEFFTPDNFSDTEARCYVGGYDTNYETAKTSEKYIKYGVFYNQVAAAKYCPKGWHVPSDEDWKELEKFLGLPQDEMDIDNAYTARGKTDEIAKKLKALTDWNGDKPADNSTGFSALPAGIHGSSSIYYINSKTMFISSTKSSSDDNKFIIRSLTKYDSSINRYSWAKEKACSVRYIRNK